MQQFPWATQHEFIMDEANTRVWFYSRRYSTNISSLKLGSSRDLTRSLNPSMFTTWMRLQDARMENSKGFLLIRTPQRWPVVWKGINCSCHETETRIRSNCILNSSSVQAAEHIKVYDYSLPTIISGSWRDWDLSYLDKDAGSIPVSSQLDESIYSRNQDSDEHVQRWMHWEKENFTQICEEAVQTRYRIGWRTK